MKRLFGKFMPVLAMCLLLAPITSYAAPTTGEMDQYPNVTLSPDGSERAWTTDLWDRTDERLPIGYTIDMNVESSIRALYAGEHYYEKEAVGSVPIGKWVVEHSPGQCIHDTVAKDTFAGFHYGNTICRSNYNNGWIGYCADCNEPFYYVYVYAKEATVKNITSVPASSVYVYLCPYCTHLEQGVNYQHLCKAISYNKYRVTYRPNAPADSAVAGYVAPTMHMYQNSDTYNGKPASQIGYTDRALRKNSFSCEGYVFTGWNTAPDGSGSSFTDGQEILNLSDRDGGIVKLYAQWTKVESSLLIDAAGGTYQGKAVYEKKQKYGTTYKVDSSLVKPPAGYLVTFITNGGEAVAPIATTKKFSHWEIQPGFQGQFKKDIYQFVGSNGNKDRIKAKYLNNGFVLPDCKSSNKSLVGWYEDPAFDEGSFVGKAGDEVTVDQDTVLYARWADLTLWAYDDYESHGGVGAVDLKWEQKDGRSKYYRLYQSTDKASWREIYSGSDIQTGISIEKSYGINQQGETYVVPYTGNYALTAKGAKGADYSRDLLGGNGGSVTSSFWLKQGDVLTVYPGTAGSGMSGGINGNGADGGTATTSLGRGGGAATQIYLTRDGIKTLLLTAGGGGGANTYASGGAGGSGGGNGISTKGADGVGAGGGGAVGGKNGTFAYHTHSEEACGYHVHAGNANEQGECYPTREIVRYEEIIEPGGLCHTCGDTVWQGDGYLSWHESQGHEVEWIDQCFGTIPIYGDYIFDCPYDIAESTDGYLCGLTETTIDTASPSYGGTNYIASGFGCKDQNSQTGINNGEGSVMLESTDVGYLEQTTLQDVLAKDMAAPKAIPGSQGGKSSETVYSIVLTPPEDRGTLYYHMAESYEEGTTDKIATSNITENVLVSGVAGYFYYIDSRPSGVANSNHGFINEPKMDVTMKASRQYLHVAAVDVAGNIGPTYTIDIPAKEEESDIVDDYVENVSPKTDPLVLRESENVYKAGIDRYYVKADGITEHTLLVQGYLNGSATNQYQVDRLKLVSSSDPVQEWYQVRIPKADINAGDKTYQNEALLTSASVETLQLADMSWAVASRKEQAKIVELEQHFTIDEANDGKQIVVYPRAIAEYDGEEYVSDMEEDKSHGITLIPDAKAPVITGIEALEDAGNIDMTEASRDYVIRATDDGSGTRSLAVTIVNQDNTLTRTYVSDTGELTITMGKADYLFLGDFVVSAEAVDNVGNVSRYESANLAFTLKAELQRARFPHNGDFKAGDGAVLTITTGGYADKVIVRFQDELLALNPDLDEEYVYEFPEPIKTEVYPFNIPLSTPSGNYTLEVEAWKNGRKLTEELKLPVRTVGSIIDEFRTRIRDNGV